MTQEELNKIIEQHQHWLKEDCKGWEGMRANLSDANLSRVKKKEMEPCLSISTATNYNGTKQNYFNINFCPQCGRNLKEADDEKD